MDRQAALTVPGEPYELEEVPRSAWGKILERQLRDDALGALAAGRNG